MGDFTFPVDAFPLLRLCPCVSAREKVRSKLEAAEAALGTAHRADTTKARTMAALQAQVKTLEEELAQLKAQPGQREAVARGVVMGEEEEGAAKEAAALQRTVDEQRAVIEAMQAPAGQDARAIQVWPP